MALHSNPIQAVSQSPELANYEQKLSALRAAIQHGDASGFVEGDIFAQIAEELGLDLDADQVEEQSCVL